MLCPRCKNEIRDRSLKCSVCGTKIGALCKDCGHYNLITATECSNCGKVLLKICKKCGAANLPEAENCRKCGEAFADKEEKIAETIIPVYNAKSNSTKRRYYISLATFYTVLSSTSRMEDATTSRM